MPDLALTIVAFLVALAILIVVHEFGHFWIARRVGVRVLRFSLGFGPPLFRRTGRRDGTEYVLAALPLGGYVKMLDEREDEVPAAELPRAFNRQALWKRTAIVAAGPLFNLIFAVAVYWAMAVAGEPGTRPLVGTVAAESTAAEAGFVPGDEILRVGSQDTPTWEAAMMTLVSDSLEGEDLPVRVRESSGGEVVRWLDGERLSGLTDSPAILDNLGLAPEKPVIAPVVSEVLPNGVAERVGIQPGDEFVAADGKPVSSWDDWVDLVRARPDTPIVATVERNGQPLQLTMTPEAVLEGDERIGRVGVVVDLPEDLNERYQVVVRLGPIEAVGAALEKTADMSILMIRVVGRMLTGQASVENLSGPITIAETAGKTASYGLGSFMKFLAVVSISLAILNLLPIPMLDGGHLLYFFIEWIKGCPLSDEAQMRGQQLGIVVLAMLMTFAFYIDLSRLLG